MVAIAHLFAARCTQSGYPFDDDIIEDGPIGRGGLRSTLDSLAARHPELADHFQGRLRPNLPNTWGLHRKRRGSGTIEDDASGSAERPILTHQGFPFDDFPSDFRQHIPEEFVKFRGPSTPESFFQQIPRKAELTKEKIAESQLEQPQKKDFSTQTDDTLFNTEDRQITSDNSETKPLSQYKFRNTVDLGQKCEPTAKNETDRSARSMSAPPEDCRMRHPPSAMGQYLSGNDKGLGANEPTVNQFANTCSSSSDQQPHVRHIPIFVEGRDEPVVNTDLGQSFPQQETFVKSDKAKASATRGPIFNAALNLTDPPNQKSNPIPEPAAPRPVPSISDPILKIQNIQKDVLELMLQVENFVGVRKDKQYIFLDEMLTRNLLKLDDVDTEGKENIRQARKEAIKCIQKCIAVLEAKADAQAEKVESVQAVGEPQVTEANKAPNDASLQQCSKDNTETKSTTTNAEVKDNTAINLNQVNKKDGQNTPPNQQSNNSTSKDEPICSS